MCARAIALRASRISEETRVLLFMLLALAVEVGLGYQIGPYPGMFTFFGVFFVGLDDDSGFGVSPLRLGILAAIYAVGGLLWGVPGLVVASAIALIWGIIRMGCDDSGI